MKRILQLYNGNFYLNPLFPPQQMKNSILLGVETMIDRENFKVVNKTISKKMYKILRFFPVFHFITFKMYK